jgi:plasmid stability protein
MAGRQSRKRAEHGDGSRSMLHLRSGRGSLLPMQSVTVRLSEPLYQQLKRRADRARRTVEDELVEVVTTAVPLVEDLPPDLAEAISPLAALDDEALWRAARSRLPADDAERLEELSSKQQREGLTDVEADETARLLRRYERAMLVRAQAAALLKRRGHDVSSLLSAA